MYMHVCFHISLCALWTVCSIFAAFSHSVIPLCQTDGTAIMYRHTYMHLYEHGLSVLAFLDSFPSTLLKHENEIDSLELKDGTADTNYCCQLPWQVSADNGLGQPNGTVAMSFLSNFLTNICSHLLCFLSVCVGVWAMTISAMSVILKIKFKKGRKGRFFYSGMAGGLNQIITR